MILLIDGYNVAKFLLHTHGADHNIQREWLVSQLGIYRAAKRESLSQVIAVFDGGLFDHRTREVHYDVAVVSAGRGYCADNVLVEYAEKFGNQAIVITNDRELQHRCREHRAQTMSVVDFEPLLEAACERTEQAYEEQFGNVTVTKLNHDDEHDAELDRLMVAGSMGHVGPKTDDDDDAPQRRQNKKSKAHRARAQLRKKLG